MRLTSKAVNARNKLKSTQQADKRGVHVLKDGQPVRKKTKAVDEVSPHV